MADRARAGLCATCDHVRLVQSSRDAVFYMCEESTRDPSLRKYPTIPVRMCTAYRSTPQEPPAGTSGGAADRRHRD